MAEVLAVGVLVPAGYHLFVGDVVVCVFEQVQPNHQGYRVARPPNPGGRQTTKLSFTELPGDLLANTYAVNGPIIRMNAGLFRLLKDD